jgi:hypothetical protein
MPAQPALRHTPLEPPEGERDRAQALSNQRRRANYGANPLVRLALANPALDASGAQAVRIASDDVLRERLLEALEREREAALIPEVEAYLEQAEDPDVRALLAEAWRRTGNLERGEREAERALRSHRSALTLLIAGRTRGATDPQAGLELLHEGLHQAETFSDAESCARFAASIATMLTRLGRYVAASDWAAWGLRGLEGMRPALRLCGLRAWVTARSLGGTVEGTDEALKELEHWIEDHSGAPPRLAGACALTRIDAWRARGESKRALETCVQGWNANQDRSLIGPIAHRLVHGLIETDRVAEALEVARQTLELVCGLPEIAQRQARLAEGMALSRHDPGRASGALEQVLVAARQTMHAPTLAQAGLYLARVQLGLGDARQARAALEVARPGLAQLSAAGRRLLAGSNGWDEVFALLEGREPTAHPVAARLELRFLGASEVRVDGRAIQLRRRFAEILSVLAMHPQGLSGEQLALGVYGEDGTLECLKTELSRLRAIVPIQTRPYRLGVSVRADFLDLEQLLSRGELEPAFALHQGPLLPDSDAPEIARTREHLEETMRRATLHSRDANLIVKLAERHGEDLALWQAALRALGKADPRHALASARVSQLRRAWGV